MAALTTSVVLVVHNHPALTRACVESLQATRGPFELCVVDNASDDETVDYLDRLARSVPLRYLRNDENVGLIRALNQGAQLATGRSALLPAQRHRVRDPRWLERLQGALASAARHRPGRPLRRAAAAA